MADGDPITRRFPDQHALIGDRRQLDSVLDEICSDLELLDRLLLHKGDILNPGGRKDIMESIRGLEEEIIRAMATPNHIRKDQN